MENTWQNILKLIQYALESSSYEGVSQLRHSSTVALPHLPLVKELMNLLPEVFPIVVLDGIDVCFGELQSPRECLPSVTDVVLELFDYTIETNGAAITWGGSKGSFHTEHTYYK